MVKSNIFLSAAMAWSLTNNGVTAFTPSQPNLSSYSCPSTTTTSTNTALTAIKNSRREIFLRTGSTIASALLTTTNIMSPANAASSPPTADELNRIRTGYANIQYLLDNWEKETTVCREQGGAESGCKRDAEAVRRYLGLRSTTDPLFQIEKVFAKVRFMDDIDPDKLEDFFQAAEDWWVFISACFVKLCFEGVLCF